MASASVAVRAAGASSGRTAAEDHVRDLARRGILADRARAASDAERGLLRAGGYALVWPVVFQRLTRRIELARGHHTCASSVHRLEAECLDKFHDDVEAVLDDLLANAKVPVVNLEGWIARRIGPATVDAHRRRRGDRGALQRPRLPGWLKHDLGQDPWLLTLAVEVLVWVGIPATAGVRVWPLSAWADRRAAVTGHCGGGEREVTADLDRVLAAMRRRPKWYADFVERPLGRKHAPVLPAARTGTAPARETDHLQPRRPDEADEARLTELASVAVTAIEAQLRRGADPRCAVVAVLRSVFDTGTGAEEMDRPPGGGPAADERVAALLADSAAIDRIANAVVELIADR
ncbi:hypothetical protein O7621_03210 [Solwaraspora sp. WMMD937]|uniref:hypothetical protein n=1 Tax=Solwaraspora sp. WMMD937 TaxID=3016090 RepID=UPI00249CE0D1|nr:hypothetical protein [Solwaraspora sp. WMMD937]WFE22375.1 hypothetical protein O7621_03210 [Solwaraspora sp. WMMD937]